MARSYQHQIWSSPDQTSTSENDIAEISPIGSKLSLGCLKSSQVLLDGLLHAGAEYTVICIFY